MERHLDDAIGSVLQRVQSVSGNARAAVESPKTNRSLDIDEEDQKKTKPAISAIQRIGGGGTAFGAGDPMLREQQRQTRELSTQTGLLRDVRRLLDRPSPKPEERVLAFG